jgi:proline dehydrogenase
VFRAFFIYLSKARWARRLITGWKFSRNAASRFIAGDTLEEAIETIRLLNKRGLNVSLDHLGENVTNPEEARRSADDYLVLMDRICETGIRANASLKLTQLGLALDYGLCLEVVKTVVSKAAASGIFVRIDMEDSAAVDRTLQVYHDLRKAGLTNVGVVIQAYLFRSQEDVARLVAESTPIRLCKGAYLEPASVAFPRKRDVDANYDKLAAMMIDASMAHGARSVSADGRMPPLVGLATHDPGRIQAAKAYARRVGLPHSALEFQMLHGIRTDLQNALAAEGYPVRVYVPYGTEWYPYFMRRLAERPANVWFFISNFFR